MNEELKGLVEQMKADGQPLEDIVAFIDKYEQENPAEEVEKKEDSQTQGAPVESQTAAPEEVESPKLEYKSENILSESGEFKFDPYKFEDLSLSTDQQGGLGASKTYMQESATTMSLDDEAEVVEKQQKKEKNKIAQAKLDAENVGDALFLDYSNYGRNAYKYSLPSEAPPSIQGEEQRDGTTLFSQGYWDNVDKSLDAQY